MSAPTNKYGREGAPTIDDLRIMLGDAESTVARLQAELRAFQELTCVVHPGEHGEGVEVPATADDVRAHMDYLQQEWDAAERRAGRLQAENAALVAALREALPHVASLLEILPKNARGTTRHACATIRAALAAHAARTQEGPR